MRFKESNDNTFNYQLLSRLQLDCKYFLGYGNGNEARLWAGNVEEQITKMRELWDRFSDSEKPEWISEKEIDEYESLMKEKLETRYVKDEFQDAEKEFQ